MKRLDSGPHLVIHYYQKNNQFNHTRYTIYHNDLIQLTAKIRYLTGRFELFK